MGGGGEGGERRDCTDASKIHIKGRGREGPKEGEIPYPHPRPPDDTR